MKKIAIPTQSKILCAHFGHCDAFMIFETEDKKIISEDIVIPPNHEPGVFPAWLAQLGVTDVICGGMGQRAITLFNENKINVFVGAEMKAPKDLVIDFVNGNLSVSGNFCDH
ncbi:MAG: ATPase [Bacteroidales bacterium]|nr:ATPase [Bacteroidales bacterium]